jgi:enoyl-CoA hydratase/carnithine racemase
VGVADLEYSVEDGIGTIRLNRPHRKNAFTMEMIEIWGDIVRDVRHDPGVRVLVVTGAGDAFCSGIDLDSFGDPGATRTPLERRQQLTEKIHRVALGLEDVDKPVIASVNGVAVGAGMDMALMTDMRIAARSARFSESYIRVGLVPGDGGCYFLPRLVGLPRALELLLTGDFVDAEEAERIGLVNRVVDDGELAAATTALARRLADAPPVAVRLIKRATYQSARADLRTSLDLIASHFGVVTSTEDSSEAMAAFREKRPGKFKGR